MKVLKRNQIIIFILALMLVTAGYLSTTTNQDWLQTSVSTKDNTNINNNLDDSSTIGDATFVNGGALVNNDNLNMMSNNTVSTSNKNAEEDDYFSNSKLQRDSMYSQNLDSYQKMLDSNTVSSEQKAIAQN